MASADLLEGLMTAAEFRLLPDDGIPKELVRGKVVTMNVPAPRHGHFCSRLSRWIGVFAEDENDLGRVVTNDSGVVTERDPDTVRGPDISYYSYKRLPKGPFPEGYLEVAPDAAFEVRSPTDSWHRTHNRVNDLLNAGVAVVCVLDPRTESLTVYNLESPPRVLYKGDTLTLPDVLPGFELPIVRFFE
ncbi:MAG: Uma2 family endonuclease [Planctomycetes bacterium]|jgi:Uma2 family endonuclease|nr:Uma2 family endonuclease [Planctomycetota bacterium]